MTDSGADEAEIRKVHFKYGYYLDKCLYNEVSEWSNHIRLLLHGQVC